MPATAAPIPGGVTAITLTDEFTALGFRIQPLGEATLSGNSLNFPITGGDADESTLLGIFEHQNSGVEITRGGDTLELRNFVVNTLTGRVFAMVWVNGVSEGAPSVFLLDDERALTFSIPLVALASAAFGLDAALLRGVVAGSAVIDAGPAAEAPIPEPSTLLMLLSGVAMLWAGGRRLTR